MGDQISSLARLIRARREISLRPAPTPLGVFEELLTGRYGAPVDDWSRRQAFSVFGRMFGICFDGCGEVALEALASGDLLAGLEALAESAGVPAATKGEFIAAACFVWAGDETVLELVSQAVVLWDHWGNGTPLPPPLREDHVRESLQAKRDAFLAGGTCPMGKMVEGARALALYSGSTGALRDLLRVMRRCEEVVCTPCPSPSPTPSPPMPAESFDGPPELLDATRGAVPEDGWVVSCAGNVISLRRLRDKEVVPTRPTRNSLPFDFVMDDVGGFGEWLSRRTSREDVGEIRVVWTPGGIARVIERPVRPVRG